MATINRVYGMVSGFDTESLVKSLMKYEQVKVDKKYQEKQLLVWQKDAYKEFSSLLRGIQSEFMDLIKPATNLRGKTMFNVFSAGVTTGTGSTTTDVTASTSADSVKGTITLSNITQLASRDTWKSSASVKALSGSAVDLPTLEAAITSGNDTFKVMVDGNIKEIALSGGYGGSAANLMSDIQAKLDTAFGVGKVSVSESGGSLTLDSVGSVVTVYEGETGVLGAIGFTAGDSNSLNLSTTLADAFSGAALDFTINGKNSITDMGIVSTDTIKQMMDKINASGAGVSVSYSSISDKFTMQATSEGAVNNTSLTDTDGFFANSLKIADGADRTAGQDALLSINGVATSRSSNTFTVDGTSITLKSVPTDPATVINIGITSDPSSAVQTIKNFITKYNELIEKITLKTEERRYRDYTPLTDEQKADMTEGDIKKWEEKAMSGLLRSDSTIQAISDNLRRAVNDPVEGLGISLKDIGITVSPFYQDRGKLVLDETKLSSALTERPNEVIELFTRESSTTYADSANRGTRDAENGWMNRINDIFNDNIRITRDANGNKGLLIEKAGSEKEGSEVASALAKRILTMDNTIATLLERMADKSELYYSQFARMESALSQMNSQFASVFGNTGSTS